MLSISFVIACHMGAVAQQASPSDSKEHDLGISLYKKGETKAAKKELGVAVRKNSADWEAWYYLGLAQISEDDLKNARKDLEKSAKLRPDLAPVHAGLAYVLMLTGKYGEAEREAGRAIALESRNADAHYVLGVVRLRQHLNSDAEVEADTIIKLNPAFTLAYLLKSQALVGEYADGGAGSTSIASTPVDPDPMIEQLNKRREAWKKRRETLARAASALETYLKLSGSRAADELWQEQLKTLKVYARDYAKNNEEQAAIIFNGIEVSSKARVIGKPEPRYTEAARKAGVEGTVLLAAVFSADGKVESILVLRSLPYGLTEQAIAAARKIKFIPAIKDGRAVSMYMHLEYNFNLY